MGSETQLAIRLRADGIGQVTSGLDAVAQSARQAAVDGENASRAIAGIGQSVGVASEQISPASNHVAESIARIGGAAEVSASQMRMARTIVVQNLINMGTAAVVTHGNIIATLSPLPDLLYGINQMGSGAAASARSVMLWGGSLAVVAASLVAVAVHASTTETRTREMTVALKAMGNASNITGEELRKLSEQAAAIGPFSRDETADAAKGLASRSLIPGSMYGDLLTASVNFSAATGQELTAGVNTLASALEKGYAGIRQLDDGMHFLTESERDQIRSMTSHGKQAEAMSVALNALNRQFKGLAQEGMSETSKAWNALGNAFSIQMDGLAEKAKGMFDWLTKALLVVPPSASVVTSHQPDIDPLSVIPTPTPKQRPEASSAYKAASTEKIKDLKERLGLEARVFSASAPMRSIVQAEIDAANLTKDQKLTEGDAATAKMLLTAQAHKQIAASARDATDVMRLNADAQERVAEAAGRSDVAMRRAAVENDIARFGYDKLKNSLGDYSAQAERAFEAEEKARRAQWAREIDGQVRSAERLAEAYRQHSVAAIDAAERSAMIEEAVKRVGVTAEEAAVKVDALLAHKWDQTALQLNRSGDPNLNYRMQSEELERARATGILSESAYAEHSKRNYHEMLEASKAWSDGAKLAVLDYTDEINNSAKQANTFFSGAFKKGEDSLVKMSTGGTKGFKDLKQSFLDFVDSMVEGLVRIGIQQEIMRPLAQTLFGGSGGGGGGF
ncbi:MAG: phage tail length tape measure family protein, partial [Magnetococcales bacterium]|nr:phage tail length tape measure family protein [Magnetococcales bacterium]